MILWDLKGGTALRSFLGHASGIKQVIISPDKRLALSVSRDKTAILWDIQSGEPLRHYIGHTDQLMTAAWHPDGREVLTGGRDNQAIRWRIDADLQTLVRWVEQNRYVRPLTCAERDAFHIEPLCVGGAELAAPQPVNTPPPAVETLTTLLPPLPTPTPIASVPTPAPAAAEAAGAAVWGVNRGTVPLGGGQVWEYSGAAGDRLSIRIAADQPVNRTWGLERQRESGLLDPTVILYSPDGNALAQADDLENGVATDAYLASISLPQTGIYRIEVRSYQNQTSGSYRLILADPRLLMFKAGLTVTAGLAVHPDGQRVLVGVDQPDVESDPVSGTYNPHNIWVWDLTSGDVVQKLAGHENTVVALAVSPDGRRALSADVNGIAILWDLGSGKEILRFDSQGEGFNDIKFLPDGQTALTTSSEGTLWDLTSGKAIRHIKWDSRWVSTVVLSPDGQTIYSTSDDNTVHLWSAATGEPIATYQPFADGLLNSLAISPDGSKLLVGRAFDDYEPIEPRDGTIALVDAKTGATLFNLKGHTAEIVSIVFSPDGRYALSGSKDKTERLWEVSTGKQLAVFTGHTDNINQVAFSPDGMTGYSTSEDGSFRVWDLRDFIGGDGQH
jgi:WD40 repeat protein